VTTVEVSTADRVCDAFIAGDIDGLLAWYAPDALVDAIVPQWRFQLQGPAAIREALAAGELILGRRVTHSHRAATDDGVLLEVEAWAPLDGEEQMWRGLHHIRIVDGLVTEHICYCSGFWDAATIARQAVEAPMVRAR
jgi:hypothetical protein